jgi:HAD superfamily hydrolase (TIGR01509 family)
LTHPRFDALLFDLGSTLIFFDTPWAEVIPQAHSQLYEGLRSAGLELDRQVFLRGFQNKMETYYFQRETEFIEYTVLYILRELLAESGYPEVPDSALRKALVGMYAITQKHWLPEPEAVGLLQSFRLQGYHLGLISNTVDDNDVQSLIDRAGLREYFEVILISAAEGIRKPNPRIFWKALERLGVGPGRAAMVGDTLGADILGAQNAGIFAIWVTKHAGSPGNRAHLDTIRPDATIETIGDLPGLLERLSQDL